MTDSTRVTGQPAPPTPRFRAFPVEPCIWCPVDMGHVIIKELRGESLLYCTELGRYWRPAKEVHNPPEAAAQPLTPPQPPLDVEAKFRAILERERTKVAEGVAAVKDVLAGRHWLVEGRGPYEWDDDRWHSEFYAAREEIRAAIAPLEKIAGDLSDCPTTQAELEAARQAAPPSLTAPLEKFGNEVSAGRESAGGNTETLTSVSAPEQRNPSGKPQPSARPSDAHSQFTSLTAEELAKILGDLGMPKGAPSLSWAKALLSLPGIKVVRG